MQPPLGRITGLVSLEGTPHRQRRGSLSTLRPRSNGGAQACRFPAML